MTKPVTTSDQLKLVFKLVLESDPDDWKRTGKAKNAEGQWVRDFANKKTGETLAVTEMEDGYFNLKGKDLEANVRLPEQFLKAAKPALSQAVIETDPAKNLAADEVIRRIMGDITEDESEDLDWGVPKKLLDDAGKALANRHLFALSAEGGDEVYAMITPIRFYQEEGHLSDQSGPISHLLPRAGEAMESTWEIYEKGVKTPVQTAQYLQSLGFEWSRDFQDFIDSSLTKEIGKAVEALEDKAAPAKAAPTAAPQQPKP